MTGLSRRAFLGGAIATTGLCTARSGFAASRSEPKLKAGLFSDLHITDAPSAAIVEKALRFFREQNVDAVVCTGDFVDHGTDEELALFGRAWDAVFPVGRGRNGRTVEKVFITGNHDVGVTGRKGEKMNPRHLDFFGMPPEPVFIKEVKGYKFVCQNWRFGGEARELLTRHAAELRREKLFFYIQHSHLKGTIPYAWITDNGKTTEVLRTFPNCVALSGHSHFPLVDERSLWQGGFTAINLGHMRYCSPCGGRENARIFGEVDPKTSEMPPVKTFNDSHAAMVMSVYEDAIVLKRHDVKYDLELADDWIVPWPPKSDEMALEERGRKVPAPQFRSGAAVSVSRTMGTNRRGEQKEQISVDFPNCRMVDGSPARALDFEVSLESKIKDVIKPHVVKRVYSRGFFRGERADEPAVNCRFSLKELPVPAMLDGIREAVTVSYRFSVRPMGAFGLAGNPIASEWVDLYGAAKYGRDKGESK